jgi:hypothetical protein
MISTVNGLSYYDFSQSYIQSIQPMSVQLTIILDQVLIRPEHPANRDVMTKRTNDFRLVIDDVREISLYEERYQLFDADMKPYREVPERKVKDEDISYDLQQLNGVEVDEVSVKEEDGLSFIMRLLVEDHTWRLEVKAAGSHEAFERFMSL